MRRFSQAYLIHAGEDYDHLEQWIQWVTAHTGMGFSDHGISALGDADLCGYRYVWELASEAGRKVRVCGSMNGHHCGNLNGFFLPGAKFRWASFGFTGKPGPVRSPKGKSTGLAWPLPIWICWDCRYQWKCRGDRLGSKCPIDTCPYVQYILANHFLLKGKAMIARVPKANPSLVLSAKLGLVAVPDSDLLTLSSALSLEEALDRNTVRELLQGLGEGLGMTQLTRQDAGFPESEAAETQVPIDPAVRRSLEGLDAVWLQGEDVVACFVVESGISGWESVRRLADLVALHPKLKAPLYAVTLPALKAGLIAELHRPAFLVPKKPLAETLRLLEWERLKTEVEQMGERVRYLKPEFLEGISEPVAAPRPD